MQEKTAIAIEARFLTKKGEIKWLRWNATMLPEAKIMIVATKDITQQKIAEQKLSTAYERLKTAQKIAKVGYWIRNLDAEISEWSEEVYNIYGYTKENFVPTLENVTKTFHADDRHLIKNNPNELLEPNKVKTFEHRIITASQEVKWVRQEIRLLTNEKQIPYRIEGTIQDITEKKENELQLSLSNERFRLAMKASNEMIWEIDLHQNTIFRSKGYEKNIRYDNNEAFAKNNSWFKKIHPIDIERVWNSLQQTLKNTKKTHWSCEYRMLTEKSATSYIIDRCFIIRDESGIPQRAVGSALDITTTKLQLKKIKNQNKNLREIAWLQSHVIRAPLSRIMGLIYLAKEHNGGGKTTEEIFDMIAISAEELDEVIHKIIEKTSNIGKNEAANITD